tara:strand:+ start:79 stop:741 length:663 start_codon:yes stop_codon:yes gene_type:complete
MLIDPRTNEPFYVGKGKRNRAKSHLKETIETTINIRKYNKIQSILKNGLEPKIVYHAIELTEVDAYNVEAELIKQYGRKEYDTHGILLNICEDNRPPGNDNFITDNPGKKMKGKTYEELYGQEKATELKASRKKTSSGREVNEITKSKMKESALKKMENGYKMPSRKGIKDSNETKLKKSLAHKGKVKGPLSDKIKQKISETKRKNSVFLLTKPNLNIVI